jgi:hypothetical protein
VGYMDGTLIHNPMVCQFMLKRSCCWNDDVDLTSNSYGVNLTSGYNTVDIMLVTVDDDDVTVKFRGC